MALLQSAVGIKTRCGYIYMYLHLGHDTNKLEDVAIWTAEIITSKCDV